MFVVSISTPSGLYTLHTHTHKPWAPLHNSCREWNNATLALLDIYMGLVRVTAEWYISCLVDLWVPWCSKAWECCGLAPGPGTQIPPPPLPPGGKHTGILEYAASDHV